MHDLARIPADVFRQLEDCMNLALPEARLLDIDDEIRRMLASVDRTDDKKDIAESEVHLHTK